MWLSFNFFSMALTSLGEAPVPLNRRTEVAALAPGFETEGLDSSLQTPPLVQHITISTREEIRTPRHGRERTAIASIGFTTHSFPHRSCAFNRKRPKGSDPAREAAVITTASGPGSLLSV